MLLMIIMMMMYQMTETLNGIGRMNGMNMIGEIIEYYIAT